MPSFIYRVRDKSGRVFSGILEADNVRSLRKKLHDLGYYVVSITSAERKRKLSFFEKKINLDTLFTFTHQLSSMIEAGLPILMSLDILWREIDHPKMQVVISQIRNELSEGKSLSEAVEKFPQVFPLMYRTLLKVAETGGGLVIILKKITQYLQKQKEFITKVKRATTYPLIVIAIAITVVILMLVGVVPTFQRVFRMMKVELPLLTTIVITISRIMRTPYFWLIAIGGTIVLYFLYRHLREKPHTGLLIDRMKLRIPVLGRIIYLASLGRFTRSLSLLVGGGLPVAESMEVATQTVVNKKLEHSLDWVKRRIVEGVALNEALRETHTFPTILVEMIAVGEQSGTLAEMLEKVANHFEEELDIRVNKFLTLLEPLLIVFVGGIVVFVLLSVYLPIIKLWQVLGQRG
ncbi:MAG: hypothetical protein DRP76_00950 [Candidatus Omnitrophota bacterium]|nr:MAG: hypothetical protein DRP76_00950 [Candidatus Omnitrophota bacterium]